MFWYVGCLNKLYGLKHNVLAQYFTPINHKDFTRTLDKGARKAFLRRTVRWSRNFHASDYTGCLRQTGYQILQIIPPERMHNPNNELAALQGTTLHNAIQEWIKESESTVVLLPGGKPAIEVELSDEALTRYRVSGRIDAVIRVPSGKLAILDIKTVASELMNPKPGSLEYKKMLNNERKYFAQLQMYMKFFSTLPGTEEPIKYGIIYLIDRGNTKNRDMGITRYNPTWLEGHLERLEQAALAVNAHELPVPEPVKGVCRYCNYRQLCPAVDENGDVLIPDFYDDDEWLMG